MVVMFVVIVMVVRHEDVLTVLPGTLPVPELARRLEIGKASALGVLTLLLSALTIGLLIAVLYRRDKGAF